MLKTEMYKKFIVFSILVVLNSHSMILSMEKDDDNATSIVVTQLDKEEKKVLLNIIAMGETFFNNTQHMLRFLKKIAKHAPYGIAPDAEEREYPNIPFELPGDESYVIRFKDAALKYIFVSDSSLDALHYIKNNDEEAEINNKKRLDKLVYNKHSNFDPKTFSSGKLTAKVLFGYQFFGRSTQGFFADPKDIKVFNQQCLHPKSLLYFLQSKQTIKIGNKPVKKDFDTAIDKDIYHYASLLYAFKKLLDFECQVPLYNLVKCDSYLNSHGINTKKFAELLKTQYLKEHYFKQFIPLLAQENSIVNDYTLFNTTKSSINEAKISDKKIKKAFEFLKRDEKTITSFDTIHNALFGLCFTMSKTRAIPNNLANIIHSVESKLNAILEHREKYIDPLYSTYKDLYSQHTLKYYGFWGNRLLQKTIHLPEEIFSGHTSPTLKEKIKIAEHKKEVELLAREAQAAQAARELLAEYGEGAQEELVMSRNSKKQKNNAHNKKFVMQEEKNNQKNKKNAPLITTHNPNAQKNIKDSSSANFQKKPVAKKKTGAISKNSKPKQIDPIAMTIQPEIAIHNNDIISKPYLLFNRDYYFERLIERKELYDHYHGIPGRMIYEVIHTGTAMPLPTDKTGKAQVFFGIAAVKTILGRYFYRVPIIITEKNGCIFHIGLHGENNAVQKIGDIVSKKMSKLQSLMEWPSLEMNTQIHNHEKTMISHSYEDVPENGISISIDEFNKQFPCVERPSDYPDTTTYILPNQEELIFLNAYAKS